MKFEMISRAILSCGALVAVCACANSMAQNATAPVPSAQVAVADPPATPEAAPAPDEGNSVFASSCAGCHGEDMAGAHGPALKGETFVRQWNGRTARNLYSRIRLTMPPTDPGSLTEAQAVTATLEILKASGMNVPSPAPATAADLSAISLNLKS